MPFMSDRGGMIITISGIGAEGTFEKRIWSLYATNGDGPFVPILPTAAAIRKILNGDLASGAFIADDAITFREIEDEMRHHNITTQVQNPS